MPFTSTGKIPHVIHVSHDGIKPEWEAPLKSWAATHPTWERKEYSTEMNHELIKERYPWFVQTFDTLKFDVERWDAARYAYMHSFGGVYHDMDMSVNASLEHVLETQGMALFEAEGYIQNYFFASKPGHDYWLKILQAISAVNSLPELKLEHMTDDEKTYFRVLCVTGWPLMTYVWKNGFNGTVSGAGAAGGTSYLVLSGDEWKNQYGLIHHFTGTWLGSPTFLLAGGSDRALKQCERLRPGWSDAIDSMLEERKGKAKGQERKGKTKAQKKPRKKRKGRKQKKRFS